MTWNNRVSVWKQRHYDGPLTGQRARQGRERQPSVCARSIWITLYNSVMATNTGIDYYILIDLRAYCIRIATTIELFCVYCCQYHLQEYFVSLLRFLIKVMFAFQRKRIQTECWGLMWRDWKAWEGVNVVQPSVLFSVSIPRVCDCRNVMMVQRKNWYLLFVVLIARPHICLYSGIDCACVCGLVAAHFISRGT